MPFSGTLVVKRKGWTCLCSSTPAYNIPIIKPELLIWVPPSGILQKILPGIIPCFRSQKFQLSCLWMRNPSGSMGTLLSMSAKLSCRVTNKGLLTGKKPQLSSQTKPEIKQKSHKHSIDKTKFQGNPLSLVHHFWPSISRLSQACPGAQLGSEFARGHFQKPQGGDRAVRGQVLHTGSSYCYRDRVRSDTGHRAQPVVLAFPGDPTDPRPWCSTEKLHRSSQTLNTLPPIGLTGHLLLDWQLPLPDGTWLMDALRAGKGLVLVMSGRMGRKRFCEPSWRDLGRNPALPTPTPSSFSLGKVQPCVSWSELHSAALSSTTGLKTHSPHRLLPEEQSSPP